MKRATLLAACAALFVVSCGGPPPSRLSRLYEGLTDELPRVDPSILRGRRILVDPGHGGYFRGTTGNDGLEETSVNLGVSLYLWGLLREAGAEIYLTRSVDRDFLSAADSSLASDLQARVDMADTLAPDIFISIHHNAQPQRDPGYNRVETYYKAGDPASLDLAFLIHRHLMRNLGIEVGEVRQGNYYVLRNVDIPAVLGESSYLTHPPVEEKLQLSRVQRLEAEAYFLGILDYFSRGIPRVTKIAPADSIVAVVPELEWTVDDDGGIGVDPDAIDLRVNGDRATATLSPDGTRITARLDDATPNGPYDVRLSVRNLLGNTSADHEDRFVIDHPPAAVVWAQPSQLSTAATTARIRARILDARGYPVADGTAVTVTARDHSVETATMDGVVEVPVDVAAGAKKVTLSLDVGGKHFEHAVERSREPQAAVRVLRVVDARTGMPVRASVASGTGEVDGLLYALRDTDKLVTSPGYVPVATDTASGDTISLQPWFGGVLVGTRFVLDPEGGRAVDAGAGPLGLPASHVNLRVAEYLAGFLRAAGASVWLTRTNEEVRTPEDIARRTNLFNATRYIELRHRAAPEDSARAVRLFHFPGSRTGRIMCEDLGRVMSRRLGVPPRAPASQVTFPLQQTGCPAIVIEAPPISNVEEELRLDRSAYLREQAYAIFAGLLEHFASPDTLTLSVEIDADDPSDWLVSVAHTWTLLTDTDGAVTFEGLPPGRHEVFIRKGAATSRTAVDLPASSPLRFSNR